jgi:hypothetical protein
MEKQIVYCLHPPPPRVSVPCFLGRGRQIRDGFWSPLCVLSLQSARSGEYYSRAGVGLIQVESFHGVRLAVLMGNMTVKSAARACLSEHGFAV